MDLHGLTAKQADQSRELHGVNALPEPAPTPWLRFFLGTFEDKINMILLGLLVLFIILAACGHGSISEPIGIGAVLLAIALINTRTGLKSEKSARELKARTSLHYCTVLRDGLAERINSTDIVVGDVVLLQSGDLIPADGFLAEGKLSVDNSVLNGESEACRKTPADAPRGEGPITGETYVDASSLFSGTTVLDGEGKMIVTHVGVQTVNGKTILSVGEIEPPRTSLELQLDHLAGQISRFGTIGAAVVAVTLLISAILQAGGILSSLWLFDQTLLALVSALSIIVAAVPEGLPLIITLITAQNASIMYKSGVLAKNAGKIPEAGNIQLLCTDKTGTLTYGKLMQTALLLADGTPVPSQANLVLQEHLIDVCVNSSAMYDADGQVIGGNATERALLSTIREPVWEQILREHPAEFKVPFNSTQKFSAASTAGRVYFKGAPERLIKNAACYLTSDGSAVAINQKNALCVLRDAASRGLRVIATAYYDGPMPEEGLPEGLTIIAFATIRDDVRKEVPSAVCRLQNAGVQVMMVTGDVQPTAKAIAEEAGIIRTPDDYILTDAEFDALPDDLAMTMLHKIKVISRATPQTKLRIVRLAQMRGISVGMTGDGTNDAPALKAADVGFSMGSGTDVCKQAGDIIITDDNFVSIGNAVLLGRTFMKNVHKFLKFQLPINLSLVLLSILFPLLFGFEAVAAVQILLINIVMDSLNSLSFGGEPAKDEYMQSPPVRKGSPLLSRTCIYQIAVSTGSLIFLFGILTAVSSVLFPDPAQAASARFALLVIASTVNGFNIRTDHYNLLDGLSRNPNFYRIAAGIFIGTILIVQFGGSPLHCTPLSIGQWCFLVVLSLLMIPIDFFRKMLDAPVFPFVQESVSTS